MAHRGSGHREGILGPPSAQQGGALEVRQPQGLFYSGAPVRKGDIEEVWGGSIRTALKCMIPK